MTNIVQIWLFGFLKVKWLQLIGEVCSQCKIFSGFHIPKS